MKKLTQRQRRVRTERLAEALRECGVLWLVFSILDRWVADTLTPLWGFGNALASVALWVSGIYIELSEVERHDD
ncbi:MAG TPA: hypothetical protein VJ276_04510 [Thermoanaerobaculia bacterium]|nr:hypothetical protein [Thermoanaerobaculia bacterium]